jgi:hypothetical protein
MDDTKAEVELEMIAMNAITDAEMNSVSLIERDESQLKDLCLGAGFQETHISMKREYTNCAIVCRLSSPLGLDTAIDLPGLSGADARDTKVLGGGRAGCMIPQAHTNI